MFVAVFSATFPPFTLTLRDGSNERVENGRFQMKFVL